VTIVLSEVALGRIFPAFVRMDSSGAIIRVGPSIEGLNTRIEPGDPFYRHFIIERPAEATDLADLARTAHSVTIRLSALDLTFVGLVVEDNAGFLFLVSHAARNVLKPAGAALGFADFSPADAGVEALTLISRERSQLVEASEATTELARARDEAVAATRAKAEFLSNMSHELRTPLTGIIGFAGLLEAGAATAAQQRTYVARIATLSRVLLTLVNDVLDFDKIETGQLDLDPQPFAALPFFQETIELLRIEAENKRLSLELRPESEFPGRLIADCARIRQILLNLIHNAIKFTDHGRVTVRVRFLAEAGGLLRITVEDTGAGIPPEVRDRLFERFSRLGVGAARNHTGSGLGLAICRGLVETMGGRIGYRPREDKGAIFWFEIPAPAAPERRSRPRTIEAGADADRARILLVDDVATNLEVLTALLGHHGYSVVQAPGGEEAVRCAETEVFDIILMDAQMPGMDGFAATEAIRRSSTLNAHTPIIAISADATRRHWEAAQVAGMNDYIVKPIDVSELLRKIERYARPSDDVEEPPS
jgi:signal transduction histidine kinase/ActR/RegA family two-component response regulator